MAPGPDGVDIQRLIALHRTAVEISTGIVGGITARTLTTPTPCAEWDLGALLRHMIAQHYGFAAAARGHGDQPSAWAVRPLGGDPRAEYDAAASEVLAAFAAPDIDRRTFLIPEIRPNAPFPAQLAIGFHLVDYVVHGWDVARSIGADAPYPPDVVAAALRVAALVPDGEARLEPGASFAPSLPGPGSGAPMDRLLRSLGRDPGWTPEPAAASR